MKFRYEEKEELFCIKSAPLTDQVRILDARGLFFNRA